MLDFVSKAIKKIVGNKSDRDLKEVEPMVKKILIEYDKLQSISNDDLRAKTTDFKQRINDHLKVDRDKVQELKDKAENSNELGLDEKEAIYKDVDEREKKILDKLEEVLENILPEAFAVVKETARRFKENEAIEVTASQMD